MRFTQKNTGIIGIVIILLTFFFILFSDPNMGKAEGSVEAEIGALQEEFTALDDQEYDIQDRKLEIVCEGIVLRINECRRSRLAKWCDEAQWLLADFFQTNEVYFEDVCLVPKLQAHDMVGARGEPV